MEPRYESLDQEVSMLEMNLEAQRLNGFYPAKISQETK